VVEALGIRLVLGFLLILALGTSAGVWVGGLTEHRIAAISGTLQKVASGQMTTRIPTLQGSRADLSRVSTSINDTFERLETMPSGIRRKAYRSGCRLGLSRCKAICDLYRADLLDVDPEPGLRIDAQFHHAECAGQVSRF
jgi:hypothetical protein